MPEVYHCGGCEGPIDDPDAPDIIRARKRSRLPSFSDKETEPQFRYFHAICFLGQRGFERLDESVL